MASMRNMGAGIGMLVVETIAKIRRAFFVQGSKPPVPRCSPTASTRPMSSSTSWRGSETPGPAVTILTPDALRLRHAPVADCARYDRLRRAG